MSTGNGTMIQTPVVGNALRERLGLDAAGRLPLTMSDEVVPVAIVADVRDLVDSSPIDCMGWCNSPAIAAQWARAHLEFTALQAPEVTRIYLDAMTLVSNTTQFVYATLKDVLPLPNVSALPQRKLSSLVTAATAGAVYQDSALAGPTTVDMGAVFALNANTPFRVDFDHPIVIDRRSDSFSVLANTVNTNLFAWFEWREETRQ